MDKINSFFRNYWFSFTLIILGLMWLMWFIIEDFVFSDLSSNLISEFAGIIFTIVVIEAITNKKNIAQEKTLLIHQLGSQNNLISTRAAINLKSKGWVQDGTLNNTILWKANLENIEHLYNGQLKKVRFSLANLTSTNLNDADLEKSKFEDTNLDRTLFNNANLKYCKFGVSSPMTSIFNKTDLLGADLFGAKFVGFIGKDADYTNSEHFHLATAWRLAWATMPDGSKYDGRYNLEGDLMGAGISGTDNPNPEVMAEYYEIPVERYLEGQQWFEANKQLQILDEDDPVYLIASGYEWTCPHCQRLNREIEITAKVVCNQCRRAYPVADADHAWE